VRYVLRAYSAYGTRKSGDQLLVGMIEFIGLIFICAHLGAVIFIVLGFESGPNAVVRWPKILDDELIEQFGEPFFIPGEVETDPTDELAHRYITSLYFVVSLLTTLGMQFLPANMVAAP
jgi:hypothetical protein